MRYNRQQLKQDIAQDTRSIRELKKLKREPFQPKFGWKEQRELREAKKVATLHCTIAAHIHNKTHLQGWSIEEQRELIKDLLPKYVLPEPAETAVA